MLSLFGQDFDYKVIFVTWSSPTQRIKNQVIFVVIYTRSDDPEEIATKILSMESMKSFGRTTTI